MKMGEDEIRWHKPVVYQEKDGARQEIAAHYAITDTNRVGFELAKYDASKPLYIDPLIYSTFLGGSGGDGGGGIAVDRTGNAYVIGTTSSTDFPTMNPLQPTYGGGQWDAFVTKFNPTGSALVYSTYLGGSGNDYGYGIALDGADNAYVTGNTNSTDFPTLNALMPQYSGPDPTAFVAKLTPTGVLVYSTYWGGGYSLGQGIAADSAGDAYVTGFTESSDFPTTPGAYQTVCNPRNDCATYGSGFVTEFNPTGSALVFSTYFGGPWGGWPGAIALDSTGNVYLTGIAGRDFPLMNPAQSAYGGGFVAKLNSTGSALVYSTYLGGTFTHYNYESADYGNSIAVDGTGSAYVTGITRSTNFPVTPGAFQTVCGGNAVNCIDLGDAFVAKLNPTGSTFIYSTYLGGRGSDIGTGIAVDSAGNAYVTGSTESANFPTVNSLQSKFGGGVDAFVSEVNPTGTALVYSTYLGGSFGDAGSGIALGSGVDPFVTGGSSSTNFPTTPGAFQTVCCGAFVAKIHFEEATTTTLTSAPNPSTYGQAVTFTATVTSRVGPPPDGETVTFKKGATVLGTGVLTGGSASFSTSALPAGTSYIKAVYGGDSNFLASTSKAWAQDVNKATTTTTLTSSLNPSNYGQAVTFTATVTPQFSGTVKATVTFYDGTTVLKTVGPSGGVAKYKTSTLTSGSHSITATFNGGTNFLVSSASLTQTVN